MEIIYPNDFVRFFNEDEEVDEVGEFEVLPEDTENSFERYYTGNEDTFNDDYPMNYRNSDNDSKFSVIPPVIKNIPDNIANVPAVIQDLPYAIKDMGDVIQIDGGTDFCRIFEFMGRGIVGGEHNVLSLYPHSIAEHQLCQRGAVTSAAIFSQNIDQERVGSRLHGKKLLVPFIPCKCLF